MILTLMKIDPFTPLDPDIQLQREIQLEIVDTLRCSLPPPRISTPEAWLRRDRVAPPTRPDGGGGRARPRPPPPRGGGGGGGGVGAHAPSPNPLPQGEGQ